MERKKIKKTDSVFLINFSRRIGRGGCMPLNLK
jgi:hypothetical protein